MLNLVLNNNSLFLGRYKSKDTKLHIYGINKSRALMYSMRTTVNNIVFGIIAKRVDFGG